ncbi:unnamed protein product [Polarella glacialis]|uniref:Helicase C-terminal domain-containing protein n=1 Tax=Polarella glacialis TaxID=89957 RepID=A0A813D544_POLGL|nr:unnamed protein product [Polarella glacialis]
MYYFSATHAMQPDFEYSMGSAIEDGVLCDYDVSIPIVTEGDAKACLAEMIRKRAGHFRRILAYCNSVAEAKEFQKMACELGLAAWHINGDTRPAERARVMRAFSGALSKPAHVLVTVQVLGEGVDIPTADTCLFVEPRSSYASIIQAIGRVLRHHHTKPLAHVILPAVTAGYVPGLSNLRMPARKAQGCHRQRQHSRSHNRTAPDGKKAKQVKLKTRHSIHGGQLERFVQTLTYADYRVKQALHDGRQGRIRFIDARNDASAGSSPMTIVRRIQHSLSQMSHTVVQWEVRLGQLQVFVARENRLPKQNSGGEFETSLGHWLKNQGSLSKNGELSQQQLRSPNATHPLMHQRLSKWNDPLFYWNAQCQGLAVVVDRIQRIPFPDDDDQEVRAVGNWFKHLKIKLGALTSQKLDILKTHTSLSQIE